MIVIIDDLVEVAKPQWMELEVDGVLIKIPFSPQLKNSEDAHKTLVAMSKSIKH